MHSMCEDRLQEHCSCQCFLWIDAITSCIRCARTDCKSTRVAMLSCLSSPSLHVLLLPLPLPRLLALPLLLLLLLQHLHHPFMHSLCLHRSLPLSSCQCFLCISAIISCTRCARTDCKNTRVASVSCVFPPSFHALDARGPIARTLELLVFLVYFRHHFMHSMREDRLPECPSCHCCFCIDAITKI